MRGGTSGLDGPVAATSPPLHLMVDDWSQAIQHDVMRVYRAKRDEAHRAVQSKYIILGFISSGTYGRVYKAQSKDEEKLHAIKKFKPDKDGDVATYTGISQSAIREIAVGVLCLYCVSDVSHVMRDTAQQGDMPRERRRSEGSDLGGKVYLYGVRVCVTRLSRELYFLDLMSVTDLGSSK